MKIKPDKKNRRLYHQAILELRHEPEEEKVIRALAGDGSLPFRVRQALMSWHSYSSYGAAIAQYRRTYRNNPWLAIKPGRSWFGL